MKIFRKRYIPDEIVDISSDEIVYYDKKMLITKWIPIKPRADVSRGVSYTLLDKGWKISKLYDQNDNFLHWYCDIIDYEFSEENDGTCILIDLLVDLKVFPNGEYEVLDMDELEEAYEKNMITKEQKDRALEKINALVEVVKSGEFPPINEVE